MKRLCRLRTTGTALIGVAGISLALAGCETGGTLPEIATEEQGPPYGGQASVNYADSLWIAMNNARLVGEDAFHTVPYEGQEPHGAVLETLYGEVSAGGIAGVAGHRGQVIVKRNYTGEDITNAKVAESPGEYLDSITVMFKREEGYDPAHNNWFWAKYEPGGTVATSEEGVKLAGRVAKGEEKGCIACHAQQKENDYQFNKSDFINE
ncbi:cytochrome P460 family protein [Thiohalorhabdus methylotrophus]|uniref:Cytochrome P460 family protein n=1 Tax=Thiohalorhabdus methylotrophus TaxID=3242694 RepID=A0ABV4TYP2_9GAMM